MTREQRSEVENILLAVTRKFADKATTAPEVEALVTVAKLLFSLGRC